MKSVNDILMPIAIVCNGLAGITHLLIGNQEVGVLWIICMWLVVLVDKIDG
jgi:hypothetical protein